MSTAGLTFWLEVGEQCAVRLAFFGLLAELVVIKTLVAVVRSRVVAVVVVTTFATTVVVVVVVVAAVFTSIGGSAA